MKIAQIRRTAAAAAALAFALAASSSQAAVITFDFANTQPSLISGNLISAPTNGVFGSAMFTDISSGVVKLTLTAANALASNLYITTFAFNLGTGATLNSVVNNSRLGTASNIPANSDTNFSFAGQTYDFSLDFANERPRELDASSVVTYTLTGTGAFSANSFLTSNTAGVFAAAQVSGGQNNSVFKTLNTTGNGSGAGAAPAAVPEPMSLSMLGLGLAGLALSRRRKSLVM
jgi:hypothetical protein